MATASSYEDQLKCSICLDVFTDPQALKCLHTFCHGCLMPLVTSNTVACPECREPSSVNEIRSDFRTKSFVEIYLKKNNIQTAETSKPSPICLTLVNKQQQQDNNIHVYCDKCKKTIYNVHYKCCVCPDYDLCATCHKTSEHSHHPLCRIRDKKYRTEALYQQIFNHNVTPVVPVWVCDACEASLCDGIRFRCFVCFDFDLCEKCEAMGVHAYHPMCKMRGKKYDQQPKYKSFFQHVQKDKSCKGLRLCDICNSIIKGMRFKCLVCPTYDLCEACEGTGVHANHPMCTIRNQRQNTNCYFINTYSIIPKPQPSSNSSMMLRAFCDSCGVAINTLRYKCCVCPDYDICRDCEELGIHLEHPMVRIRDTKWLEDAVYLKVLYGNI